MWSTGFEADARRLFPGSYAEARAQFRRLSLNCDALSFQRALMFEANGPDGTPLSMDITWLGPTDAANLVIITSGTHGVEGFAGSAIQCWAIEHWAAAFCPSDTAVVMIHAVNPYGFAYLRRCDAEGIDLNRNFLENFNTRPENADYARFHDLLIPTPQQWDAASAALREALLADPGLEGALTRGQYDFATGLFYGGQAPSESRCLLEAFVAAEGIAERRSVAVIDIHTGLSPYSYGELICEHHRGTVGHQLTHHLYGEGLAEPNEGTSSSAPKVGLIDYGWDRWIPDAVSIITLEFGTYPPQQVIDALRLEHACHQPGRSVDEAQLQTAKQSIRRAFFPDQPSWNTMVLCRGAQVLGQALGGIARFQRS